MTLPPPPTHQIALASSIFRLIAETYQIPLKSIQAPGRKQPIAIARQIACYLLRKSGFSLWKITNAINRKSHKTTIHAINRISKLRKSDPDFNTLITHLLLQTKTITKTLNHKK